MTSRTLALVMVVLLTLVSAAFPGSTLAAEGEGPGDPAPDLEADARAVEAFVDGFVSEHMEPAHVPGLAITVVHGGEVVLASGFGTADLATGRPMTPQTNLRAGSVSKPVTSAAALQLVDEGRIALDAPVSRYLPDLPLEDAFGPASTIAHLLTLQGGYADAVVGSHAPTLDTWQPLGEYLSDNLGPRVIPPGEVYSYNSWEHALLGHAMENVTGKPFDEVIAANLFGPLGMERSTFTQPLPEGILQNLATGYAYQNGAYAVVPLDYVNLSPGIALVTTAEDMSRFMLALLNGGELEGERVLEGDSVAGMLTRQGEVHPDSRARTFGLSEITLEGRPALYHEGNGIGFGSRLILVPESNFGVFASVNHRPLAQDATPTAALRFLRDLTTALVAEYVPTADQSAASSAPLPGAAARAPRYAGQYRLASTPRTDFFKVGALLDYVDVRDNRDGTVSIGSGRYVEVEPLVFRGAEDPGRVVVFVEDERGEVGLLTFGGTGSYEKVRWYETANFHLALVAFLLIAFLSSAIVWPVRRRGHWLPWLVSVINLAFLVGLGLMLTQADLLLFFKTIPPGPRLLLALPVVSAMLAVGLPVVLVRSWGRGEGWWSRARLTLVAAAQVGFLWFVFYWNLYLI